MAAKDDSIRIRGISSVNFRSGRRSKDRFLDEPMKYVCSVCGKRRSLGKDSPMIAKILYDLGGKEEEVSLCDKCVDVLADVARFGPRVINEAHRWKRRSCVVKIVEVEGNLFCFRCLGVGDSHILFKYDDFDVPGEVESYGSKRICAKCAVSYLTMMMSSDDVCAAKFPQKVIEKVMI